MPKRDKLLRRVGVLMIGVLVAPGVWADQIVLDDLIVVGSACIGTDCLSGEQFGFDTLKLKEKNVRIRFDDTSDPNSPFQSNDWQIRVNDAGPFGGVSHFSIEDLTHGRAPFTIRAGAPSTSLYVDDSGGIGFGTSIPAMNLHVVAGDAPTLRLEQDGSLGFAPQIWDVGGNDVRFFIRDVSSSSALRLTIDADSGDVTVEEDLLVGGDLTVEGTKSFAAADPENPAGRLYFSALEGPEVGTYYRGTAETVDGTAVVELPRYFTKVTEAEGLTVHLTPLGRWARLFVAEAARDRLVIREANGADKVEFSFLVHGVRRGYADFRVERPASRLGD